MRTKRKDKVLDGKKIEEKRKERGLSINALATASDLSYSMTWRAEKLGTDMYVSDLAKLAAEINTSVSELLLPTVTTIS